MLSGQVSSSEEGLMEGVLVSAKKEGSSVTTTVVSNDKGQFAFPAGVARVDDFGDIFVFNEFAENINATRHSFGRCEVELRRHNGQLLHVPLILFFHRGWHAQLKKMADGRLLSPLNVLVVDDDVDARDLLKTVLEQAELIAGDWAE